MDTETSRMGVIINEVHPILGSSSPLPNAHVFSYSLNLLYPNCFFGGHTPLQYTANVKYVISDAALDIPLLRQGCTIMLATRHFGKQEAEIGASEKILVLDIPSQQAPKWLLSVECLTQLVLTNERGRTQDPLSLCSFPNKLLVSE